MATIDLVRSFHPAASAEAVALAERVIAIYTALFEEIEGRVPEASDWKLTLDLRRSGSMRIEASAKTSIDGDTAKLYFSRTLGVNEGRKYLGNDLFTLSPALQKKGLSNLVNAAGAKALKEWGGTVVKLHANIDVGGYAWLRKGFWPDDGRTTLDRYIQRGLDYNLLTKEQAAAWKAMTGRQLRAFVLTPAFQAYKPAFLGAKWFGEGNLNDPEFLPLFTGEQADPLAAFPGKSAPTTNIFKHESDQASHLLNVTNVPERRAKVKVSLGDLIPTQDDVELDVVRGYLDGKGRSAGDRPLVIQFPDGRLYVQDGHHRVAARLLAGDAEIDVDLVKAEAFDFDDDGNLTVKWGDEPPPEPKVEPAPVVPARNANEEYLDSAVRHQVGIRRYSAGLSRRVAALLEKADAELTLMLRERLVRFAGRPVDFTSDRWKALISDIRDARRKALSEVRGLSTAELKELAALEGQREVSLLTSAVPIEVAFATVAPDQLKAILTSKPFQGRLLKDWFATLEADDQRRVQAALQLGMVEGEPIDEIVRRITGTRAQDYADGILAMSRRDATAIVRTAVNHVSNTARNYVWEANEDVIQAKVWTSTLDGRTSPICRARDGHMSPVGDNDLPEGAIPLSPPDARPPAHINCRSVLVATIDGLGLLGNRPTVVDTRNRRRREIDFRAEAKRRGVSIKDVRAEWAAANVGRVAATTNYQDFLRRQSASFQDEVLGKTKGRLFRQGGLTLDQFVDRRGNELTLSQLAATRPEAFGAAGLDPGGF